MMQVFEGAMPGSTPAGAAPDPVAAALVASLASMTGAIEEQVKSPTRVSLGEWGQQPCGTGTLPYAVSRV